MKIAVVALALSAALAAGASCSPAGEPRTCAADGERAQGAAGYEYVEYRPCCSGRAPEEREGDWGRFCPPALGEGCAADGERSEGEEGCEYVPWRPCCNGMEAMARDGDWGKFCDGGSGNGDAVEECAADGMRNQGAEGYPEVKYMPCCNGQAAVERAGYWGKFCDGGSAGGDNGGECAADGEKSEGAEGYPLVVYRPCCNGNAAVAREGDWGKFCEGGNGNGGSGDECAADGERNEGAEGYPEVRYLPCCNGQAAEAREGDWGKFCTGGDATPSGNGGTGEEEAPSGDGGDDAPTSAPTSAPTNAPTNAPTSGSGGGNAPTGPGASALTGTSGFDEECGKENGQTCEEGLSCETIQSSNLSGSQKAVCFRLVAEGAACGTGEQELSVFDGGDPRYRVKCSPGLLCVDSVCVPDDGRAEACNPGGCQREDEVCSPDRFPSVCEKAVPFGTACSVGQVCERGPYRTEAACIDGICRSIANLADPCGENRVCATGAQRAEFFFQDGEADLSCQEGYCGEMGDGGLYKVCAGDGECAASGRVCARSQEGASRCLDVVSSGTFFGPDCPVDTPPTEYARIDGRRPTSTCGEGLFCEAKFLLSQRGIDVGVCVEQALVPVGGTCSFDRRCVDTDGAGGDVFCERQESSNDGVCIVDSDPECSADSDCNGDEGATCVKARVAYNNRKRCWKYNQQPGQSCVSDDAFGQVHDEACAEGLFCFENVGESGRGTTTGRCVRFVEDGESCNPEDSVLCRGQQFQPVRSVCNNGTCRQFLGPYE